VQDATIHIDVLTGEAIRPVLHELATLRIRIFHDWPYLYEGDQTYEMHYVEKYAATEGAMVAIATDTTTNTIIGASTALPLKLAEPELQAPFIASGMDVGAWYYFGESVLDAAYRGKGIGIAFFEAREKMAAQLGYKNMAFCSVMRPDNHHLKPAHYKPLDNLWNKRGFVRDNAMIAYFEWRDIAQEQPTTKPLVFWLKTTA
jgi:GNAT superfamily N-acetyltransferase